ncbi:hypothetical protein AVEN_103055-1 [Araneus ventricosus]|uniref:Uncharacterized protein n=1 Tax=Araneus ventricosus TaxID=182803 RepID=A0A4Y2BAF9_ARAVE|nr:hypothetical protein AVEN_103055-1 [Araneus ventricosus]
MRKQPQAYFSSRLGFIASTFGNEYRNLHRRCFIGLPSTLFIRPKERQNGIDTSVLERRTFSNFRVGEKRRITEALPRITEALRRITEALRHITETLRRITEASSRITESLRRITDKALLQNGSIQSWERIAEY